MLCHEVSQCCLFMHLWVIHCSRTIHWCMYASPHSFSHPSTETMRARSLGGCQVCPDAYRMKCWQCRYPVQAGDAIWMAPYVVQWYAALGQKSSRYILYKDTTLDPLIATWQLAPQTTWSQAKLSTQSSSVGTCQNLRPDGWGWLSHRRPWCICVSKGHSIKRTLLNVGQCELTCFASLLCCLWCCMFTRGQKKKSVHEGVLCDNAAY